MRETLTGFAVVLTLVAIMLVPALLPHLIRHLRHLP